LQSRVSEAIEGAYFNARRLASSETEVEVDRFPEACPYDRDTILNHPI
jgi:hypothetical protein